MTLEIQPALAEIIARAYTTGIETSIQEISHLLDLSDFSKLAAAVKVVEFTELFQLELAPPPVEAEFDTVRVLRSCNSPNDPANHVRQLLTNGEGPSVEYKSSMFCSMRDWKKTGQLSELPALSGELLKTVCAFLNSDGGDLIIGANDEGSACEGVKLDLELKGWNLDKWQLHFQTLIVDRFQQGAQVQPFLRTTMLELDSMPVFHVAVMPRRTRSFVRREKRQPYEFFVRNGPRTDSLDLPQFYAHLSALSEA